MLRWVILCVAVVVLAAGATLVADKLTADSGVDPIFPSRTKVNGPQPEVEIEGALTHEFGSMSTWKVGTHKWRVKNQGKGNLEIFLAGSNCMCTVAKLSEQGTKQVVKPGESTDIEVEWKTKNQVGEFAKYVKIGTNDPIRPEFLLNVHGNVHTPIVVLPEPENETILVGDISNEKPNIVAIAVFAPEMPEMKIKSILTSKPNTIVPRAIPFTKQELEKLKIKGGYKVEIEFKAGMPQGDIREEVIIETDHPDKPKLQYNLVGTAIGPINVIPYRLQIMAVNGKEGATGMVTMLVREGRSTKFTVERKPAKINIQIVPNETPTSKGRYRLTVTVPPGTSPGLIDEEIILKTDHPKAPEVKVPVNIVVGAG
ncbi:MAG: DUF1573 domain-containing protein [Isosphaeraceae bacterium]